MRLRQTLAMIFTCCCFLAPNSYAQSNASQCVIDMMNDPALAPLKGKVAFNVEDQTVEMLANNQKPTPEEKKAILLWDTKRTECIKEREAVIASQPYSPAVRAVELNYQNARKNLIASLYARSISYGEFAKRSADLFSNAALARVEAVNQTSKQISDEMARDRLVRAQENQANAAQRNAETNRQAQANYMIGLGANILNSTAQPATPPAPPPRNVQCIQQGVFTNCTGY